jgi:hypothetical protein
MRGERKRSSRCAAALAVLGWMAGCSVLELSNVDARFLTDYARLEARQEGGFALGYRNPDARFEAYDAVLLEPVQVWRGKGTRDLSVPDGQLLASRLYALVYRRLAGDFRMVNQPVRRSLRIGVALTGSDRAAPFLYATSTVLPRALPVSEVQTLESGTPAGVGGARIEARIRDAASGEVLMEGIYPPVGGGEPARAVDTWSDVDRSFAIWADQLGAMLGRERRSESCSGPGH